MLQRTHVTGSAGAIENRAESPESVHVNPNSRVQVGAGDPWGFQGPPQSRCERFGKAVAFINAGRVINVEASNESPPDGLSERHRLDRCRGSFHARPCSRTGSLQLCSRLYLRQRQRVRQPVGRGLGQQQRLELGGQLRSTLGQCYKHWRRHSGSECERERNHGERYSRRPGNGSVSRTHHFRQWKRGIRQCGPASSAGQFYKRRNQGRRAREMTAL